MNNKIFFDLCSYNLDVFKAKLKDIKFLIGITYFVDLFIINKSLSSTFVFTRVKTIPFTLLKDEDREVVINRLYGDIFRYISYSELGEYSDENGVYYEKAFYIDISVC
jgi:hypothetical protein